MNDTNEPQPIRPKLSQINLDELAEFIGRERAEEISNGQDRKPEDQITY